MWRGRALHGVWALAALFVAACSGSPRGGPLVFAAASTRDALEQVADAFAEQGGARPRLHFAASASLAQQVELGVDADVFVSAHPRWTDRLVEQGRLLRADVYELLAGSLVWIAPTGASYELSTESDASAAAAASAGGLALGDPEYVPAGAYARQALQALGWWAALEARVVPAADVRAALTLVDLAEVDAGIVYASDARLSERVRVVFRFPPTSHEPVRYTLGVLRSGREPEAAQAFADFLLGPEAGAIFARHGFEPLR